MNKELIKQLEGVGFEERKNYEGCFRLRLKKDYHFDYYDDDTFYCYFEGDYVEGLKGSYDSPTFPQIIAAIKEHTGVDLTKKTKREEIEELKTKVATLEDSISKISLSHQSDSDKFRVKLKSLQDAIKSQNDAIDGLKNCVSPAKHKYFFGVDYGTTSDCIDALRFSVNEMIKEETNKKLSKPFEFKFPPFLGLLNPYPFSDINLTAKSNKEPNKQASEMPAEEKKGEKLFGFVKIDNQGSWKGSRVEVVTETNFGATVKLVHCSNGETRFFKFNELSLDREPVKQEEQEKKAFEVGDRVVLKFWECYNDRVKAWIKQGRVFVIHSFKEEGVVLSLGRNIICYELGSEDLDFCIFSIRDLEHAPKESPKEKLLEFGKPAKLLYTIDSDYCEGATVLVCDTMKTGDDVSVIVNGRAERTISAIYLKPL